MIRIAAFSLALALGASVSFAQDQSGKADPAEVAAGQSEFMMACAACHGEKADGNGPIATMFRNPVPNLTGLSARNNGVFPFMKVFRIIDGRAEIRGHGNPMPVFGNRFRAELGEATGPFGAEGPVRARVLELTFYLQSVQH
ncbi:MAG: c-type cytochrome [Paracoccaceae bacterium]|nr:c-type cytochrome [Paracoccaceae bacterium]